mgnify:CR=1 FL=1
MILGELLRAVGGRRPHTTIELFRLARRYRDEGRFEEAAELVARGLESDPRSVVGHLLAGSLHLAFREMDRARAAFERVLALDPLHPRALLGLARIALDAGDGAACAAYLRRALDRYPEFPEAQALLDVVSGVAAQPTHRSPGATGIHVDRLRVPPECRELLLVRGDAQLLAAQPRGARTEQLAARTARVARLAAALLRRAGLGGLRHALIDDTADVTVLKADEALVLALTFGREADPGPAILHTERVWAHARREAAGAAAEPAP